MSRFEINDWITPGSLVLSLRGALDDGACRSVAARLHQLLTECPGIRLTLELSGVEALDDDRATDLFLDLVMNRAQSGSLQIACPSQACLPVLKRLNLDFLAALPIEGPRVEVTA